MLTALAPRLIQLARDVVQQGIAVLEEFDLYIDRWEEHLGLAESVFFPFYEQEA